jgi:muramidase (phage lysozyme)
VRDAIALLALLEHGNVRAFLRLIRAGESSQDDDAYRWLFGSTRKAPKLFESFADHPRVRTYEAYDGQFIKNGKIDYTTAAGAYQITETTWGGVAKRLGLADFSPRSQDIAACGLVDARGALDDVLAGAIERAMFKCRQEWASLPASTYGQPTQSVANALAVYRRYGGLMHAPTPAPQPLADQPAAADPAPSQPIPEAVSTKEPTMVAPIVAPLLIGLAKSMIDAFTPLAREKLTKEMARHTDDSEVASQIATGIIDTAKALTGKDDPIEAVVAARAEPEIVQQVQANALDTLDRMAPLLDKIAEWDQQEWSAEEASKDAAAARRRLEEYDMAKPLLIGSLGVVLMLILFVGGVAIVQLVKTDEINTEIWAAMTGLIGWATAKAGSLFDYRFGTSRSSGAKDVVIGELSKRKA